MASAFIGVPWSSGATLSAVELSLDISASIVTNSGIRELTDGAGYLWRRGILNPTPTRHAQILLTGIPQESYQIRKPFNHGPLPAFQPPSIALVEPVRVQPLLHDPDGSTTNAGNRPQRSTVERVADGYGHPAD